MNVSQIAYESGYNSVTHFIAQFEKITRQTPSEYRTRIKLWEFLSVVNDGIQLTLCLDIWEQVVWVCLKYKLAFFKTLLDWFRVTSKTPFPATSCHHYANPLFDAQCPFALFPKQGINVKKTYRQWKYCFFGKGFSRKWGWSLDEFLFMSLPFSRWSKVGNHARFLDMQNIANQR